MYLFFDLQIKFKDWGNKKHEQDLQIGLEQSKEYVCCCGRDC